MAKLKNSSAHVNTEKLTEEVAKLIGIDQVNQDEGIFVKIPLSFKLGKCYEDDEIIIYSVRHNQLNQNSKTF